MVTILYIDTYFDPNPDGVGGWIVGTDLEVQ